MIRSFVHVVSGLSVLALSVLPSVAWACPYCAARNDAGMSGTLLMGAMIALPFLVFLAVIPTLRGVASVDGPMFPSDSE